MTQQGAAFFQNVLLWFCFAHQDWFYVQVQHGTLRKEQQIQGWIVIAYTYLRSHVLLEESTMKCGNQQHQTNTEELTLCFSIVAFSFWAVQKSKHMPSMARVVGLWSRLNSVLMYWSTSPGFCQRQQNVKSQHFNRPSDELVGSCMPWPMLASYLSG